MAALVGAPLVGVTMVVAVGAVGLGVGVVVGLDTVQGFKFEVIGSFLVK